MPENINNIQAEAEKPLNRVGNNKICLAMKTLTIEQLEVTTAGKINWACIGQAFDGVGVLGSVAFLLTASNPIGWGILAASAIGLAASIAADPTACD